MAAAVATATAAAVVVVVAVGRRQQGALSAAGLSFPIMAM
jgi:hypothetical protein